MDIDKLTHYSYLYPILEVLVLCWILINLHVIHKQDILVVVLVLCWILINLHIGGSVGASVPGFSTLLDIDKLTLFTLRIAGSLSFSTLLDIDKLTPTGKPA